MDFNIIVEKMQSYIKVKGDMKIGPLIQHTKPFVNNEEELDVLPLRWTGGEVIVCL